MRDRFRNTNKLVGTFVILGIALLITFTALVMIKNKTLVDKVYYKTILDHARGLTSNPPIYFKGFQIGRIHKFELDSETNEIHVSFYVYKNYADKIIKYAVISRVESLLPGSSNEYELLLPERSLIPGLAVLNEGELVPFVKSEQGKEYAEKGGILVQLNSIESILASVNSVMQNLQKESNAKTGEIFVIVKKLSAIADNFHDMSEELRDARLVDDFKLTVASIQALIKSTDATIQRADQAIIETSALLANAKQVARHVDSLLVNYEDPASIITEVSDNKMPELIEKANANLVYLEGILKEIYLQREELAATAGTLNNTLTNFDKTLEGINSNPLIKDGIQPESRSFINIEVNEN
jgi:ABC-type transporter Mla subunit MlaD